MRCAKRFEGQTLGRHNIIRESYSACAGRKFEESVNYESKSDMRLILKSLGLVPSAGVHVFFEVKPSG
jgi:hypothetical protein